MSKKRSPRSFDLGSDPQVIDWLDHQHNKTLSIKLLIHLAVANYQKKDLVDAIATDTKLNVDKDTLKRIYLETIKPD